MDEQRQANRQPITIQRNCVLGVISFKRLEWTDHVVQVVDISSCGVGVDSDDTIEPGFVWFRDRVGGCKGGVLLWSKRQGDRNRAGIRFVSLTNEAEQSLRQWPPYSNRHQPCRNPEEIISTMMTSMTLDET